MEQTKDNIMPVKRSSVLSRYTLGFFCAALLVFGWYLISGRSFLWYRDGYNQHFKAMVYISRYLKQVAGTLFSEHRLVLPSYDFTIGEGTGVLETLHFYGLGDPFVLISAILPERFLVAYYMISVLLRLYLAGLAFLALVRYCDFGNENTRVLGALSYVFSFWGIFNVVRHSFFLNPMITLPLLILGVEKALRKEKNKGFIATVFLAAISQFYFFYMQVLLVVIYTVLRLVHGRFGRRSFTVLWSLLWRSLLGVLLASPIVIPMLRVFLDDARAGITYPFHVLYPLVHYVKMLGLLLSVGDSFWACFGFPLPFFFCLVLLFRRRKEHGFLVLLTVSSLVLLSLPFFGRILNGFSYATNRWSFAFALLAGVLMTVLLPELTKLSDSDRKVLWIATASYAVLMIASVVLNGWQPLVNAALLLALLFLLSDSERARLPKRITAIGIVAGSIFLSFFLNGLRLNTAVEMDYAKECVSLKDALSMTEQLEALDILRLNGTLSSDSVQPYRYSGSELAQNENFLAGMSSTQYFWSLGNPYLSEYRNALGLNEYSLYKVNGYDHREALLSLAGVRYYISSDSDAPVPFGYAPIGQTAGGASVYQCENAFPMVWSYPIVFARSEWDQFSIVDKEKMLLGGIVLEDEDIDRLGCEATGMTEVGVSHSTGFEAVGVPEMIPSSPLDYEIIPGSGVTVDGNTFHVTSADSVVTLRIPAVVKQTIYVTFEGGRISRSTPYLLEKEDGFLSKLYVSRGDMTPEVIQYATDSYAYYNGRDTFTVSLGFCESETTEITVRFQRSGDFTFDNIRVDTIHPGLAFQFLVLRNQKGQWDCSFETDTVIATGYNHEDEFVFFSIPYSPNWVATVDGNPAEIIRADVAYMAVAVPKGDHTVTLHYDWKRMYVR